MGPESISINAGSDGRGAVLQRVLVGLGQGLAYAVVLVSPDFVIEWVSPSSWHLLGHRPEDLIGTSALTLCHPDELDDIGRRLAAVAADGGAFGRDPAGLVTQPNRLRHADGSWHTFDVAANNLTSHPDVRGYVLVLREATTDHLTLEVLHRLARGEPVRDVLAAVSDLLRSQVRGSQVAIVVRGEGRALVTVAHGDVPLGPPDVRVPVEHPVRSGEVRLWLPPGTEVSWWCREVVERAAELVRLALTRELGELELRRAAQTDPLTGVTNRAGLTERLERLAASRWGGVNAVLYVDLDDFKQINDRHGHAAGDAVLVECAARLRACLRHHDLLARPGGDEFVAVCTSLPDVAAARAVAERMVAHIAAPIAFAGASLSCGATVGVAVGGEGDADRLLSSADAALLRAKRSGKGRVEVEVDTGGTTR